MREQSDILTLAACPLLKIALLCSQTKNNRIKISDTTTEEQSDNKPRILSLHIDLHRRASALFQSSNKDIFYIRFTYTKTKKN